MFDRNGMTHNTSKPNHIRKPTITTHKQQRHTLKPHYPKHNSTISPQVNKYHNTVTIILQYIYSCTIYNIILYHVCEDIQILVSLDMCSYQYY